MRVLWDLLLFVFTTGLVIYVPMLIAFYASMTECAFFSDAAGEPTYEPNVPPPGRGGITFMTLTNVAFLVRQAVLLVIIPCTVCCVWLALVSQ